MGPGIPGPAYVEEAPVARGVTAVEMGVGCGLIAAGTEFGKNRAGPESSPSCCGGDSGSPEPRCRGCA